MVPSTCCSYVLLFLSWCTDSLYLPAPAPSMLSSNSALLITITKICCKYQVKNFHKEKKIFNFEQVRTT